MGNGLTIEQGDYTIEIKNCDAGLLYLKVRNNAMQTEASTQITKESRNKIQQFLNHSIVQ
jgi:hypothetical protein